MRKLVSKQVGTRDKGWQLAYRWRQFVRLNDLSFSLSAVRQISSDPHSDWLMNTTLNDK